jgi:glycosyltransferase involved in cell wall biosynthesis
MSASTTATSSPANSDKSFACKTAILCVVQDEGLGAETVLAEIMHAWNVTDHPLVIVAPAGSRIHREGLACGFETHDFAASRDSFIPNFKAARKVATALSDCTVIHAWNSRALETGLYFGRRLGIPVCGTLLDHANAYFHGTLRKRVMKFSANRFQHLVGASQAVIDVCREFGYTCPMSVVYTGLTQEPVPLREPSDNVRIGFLGMYAEWKGFNVIKPWIEGTQDLPATWQLYGDIHAKVQPLFDQLDTQNFIVRGFQPTKKIFTEIDVLVHASTHFDPLPTVLIEAARAGIPVIASTNGGSPEVVNENETGYLFDTDHAEVGMSALRDLIADTPRRLQMGEAARKRYEDRFAPQQVVDGYNALWKGLATDTKRLK